MKWGGDWDLVYRVAIWGVVAGIVGARVYHLITSWNQDSAIHAHWYGPFAVWSGGLGIWGAIPLGVLAGAVGRAPLGEQRPAVHGRGRARAPARAGHRPLGELLQPGAVREGDDAAVGPEDRRDAGASLHHPTFLYEFIWDLLGVALLLWIDRRFTIRRPALFSLYVAVYTAFRTFEETLRIDPSNHFLGQRINFWVSLVCFVASVAFFVWWQFLRKPSAEKPARRSGRGRSRRGRRMAVPKGRVR